MGTIIYDSDRLSAMTESLVEHDTNGNILEYMGICDHLDDIPVSELLEAQRRAIYGGGGSGPSGSTVNINSESSQDYPDWSHVNP